MASVRKVAQIEGLPNPTGPYCHYARAGNFIFITGQVGRDPQTGKIPEDAGEQTRIALERIRRILEIEGGTMESLVKTTVLVRNMSDYSAMNKTYVTYFKTGYPARFTAQANLALREFKVEIEAIAYMP